MLPHFCPARERLGRRQLASMPTQKSKKPFADTLVSHQPKLGPTCPFLNQSLARDDSNGFKRLSVKMESASPLSLRQWGDKVEPDKDLKRKGKWMLDRPPRACLPQPRLGS